MTVRELITKYTKLESQLRKELDNLENGKSDCTCNNPDYIQFVAYDNFTSGFYVQTICINCGGHEIEQ